MQRSISPSESAWAIFVVLTYVSKFSHFCQFVELLDTIQLCDYYYFFFSFLIRFMFPCTYIFSLEFVCLFFRFGLFAFVCFRYYYTSSSARDAMSIRHRHSTWYWRRTMCDALHVKTVTERTAATIITLLWNEQHTEIVLLIFRWNVQCVVHQQKSKEDRTER